MTKKELKLKVENGLLFGNGKDYMIKVAKILYDAKNHIFSDYFIINYLRNTKELINIDKDNLAVADTTEDYNNTKNCVLFTNAQFNYHYCRNAEENNEANLCIHNKKLCFITSKVINTESLSNTETKILKFKSTYSINKEVELKSKKDLDIFVVFVYSINAPIVIVADKDSLELNNVNIFDLKAKDNIHYISTSEPINIEETEINTKISSYPVQSFKNTVEGIYSSTSISKEKVKYDKNGEVIKYSCPENMIEYERFNTEDGYEEYTYFRGYLIKYNIVHNDSPEQIPLYPSPNKTNRSIFNNLKEDAKLVVFDEETNCLFDESHTDVIADSNSYYDHEEVDGKDNAICIIKSDINNLYKTIKSTSKSGLGCCYVNSIQNTSIYQDNDITLEYNLDKDNNIIIEKFDSLIYDGSKIYMRDYDTLIPRKINTK